MARQHASTRRRTEFTSNGDSAPNERYNYRFTEVIPNPPLTATASSTLGGQWATANAIDGNGVTNWSSNNHGSSVANRMDLWIKAPLKTVAGITLTPRARATASRSISSSNPAAMHLHGPTFPDNPIRRIRTREVRRKRLISRAAYPRGISGFI